MSTGPWLIVVVEGPSEGGDDGRRAGVVGAIVRAAFGPETWKHTKVKRWAALPPLSPARRGEKKLSGFAEKARRWVDLASGFGCALLLDADGLWTTDPASREKVPERLFELQRGVKASNAPERAAVGVAVEMIEAWLLADPVLCSVQLPEGRRPEELWGDARDASSKHPKQVLRRCVLEPLGKACRDVIEMWDPDRAAPQAPSLAAFIEQVRSLARRSGQV